MGELEAIYAIWLREFKVYLRERERVISSLISPLLWLFAFGTGLGSSVSFSGVNYQQFIFPGIITMSILFTSIFYGTYIIWDKRLDFLKAVLVAPISRSSMVAGKVLGGLTDVMPQVLIILIAGILLLGIKLSMLSILYVFGISLLIAIGLICLGLTLGANMSSPEGFSLVMTFLLWPLFLFSGALYPVDNLPPWLAWVTHMDPVAYGVDMLQGAIIGVQHNPVYLDLAVLILFAIAMAITATISFGRMQQTK
ncbi:ABC-2 type transporter [Candidatus Gugararchaeum adminiculabundum]|nr:ABC-2 type transporter [Candidatus Gugararchaeum adminiculabundum]